MRIRNSIGAKLLFVLISGLVLSYGLLTYLIVTRETSRAMAQALENARESAGAIAHAIRETMDEGRADVTTRLIRKMAGNGPYGITITDARGKRVLGGESALSVPAIVHETGEPFQELRGDTAHYYMPIRNEQTCVRCHEAGVLRGVIIVSVPLGHIKKDISETEIRLILYGLFIMCAGSFILYAVVSRFISRPLHGIKTGIDAYRQGDFNRRISEGEGDEFSDVAETFNGMADRLNSFHDGLERLVAERTDEMEKSKEALRQKTEQLMTFNGDLQTIVSFPYRFVLDGRKVKDILRRFASAVRDELRFGFVEIYYVYRHTEDILSVVASDTDIPERDWNKLRDLISAGEILEESGKDGGHVIYLPLCLPRKGACRDINQCGNAGCPAYGVPDAECWNVRGAQECRDKHTGREIECLQCDVFPFRGLLVAGSAATPSEYSISALKLVAMEIAYVAATYDLLLYERNMVEYLRQIHDTTMNSLTASDVPHLFSILSRSDIVTSLFDGLSLWLFEEGGGSTLKAFHSSEDISSFDINSILGHKIPDRPVERYDIGCGSYYSAIVCPLVRGSIYFGAVGLFKSYKRTFRPEERAVASLISEQVSHAVENILLHGELDNQNLELRCQKDFAEKIFNSITSGILVVGDDRRVLKSNPYAANALGQSVEDLAGADLDKVIPGLLDTASSGQREGDFTLGSSRTIFLGFTTSPLQDRSGRSGTILLFRDLTEIAHLRRQLRRKEYFSAIGEMASGIAHEVRNPLFAIASIARILLKQAEGEEQQRFVNSILKETGRLDALIDDLLQFGKPLELESETVVLEEFLAEIAGDMRSMAAEYGCVLETGAADAGLSADIDKSRMKQVFYNLIKNSLDAGASLIEVRTEDTGESISVSVRDDGKGIKHSEIERVFTPFFTTKKGGTGLGLAICKKIIEEHGGSVRLAGGPDMGTEVTIEINKPAL